MATIPSSVLSGLLLAVAHPTVLSLREMVVLAEVGRVAMLRGLERPVRGMTAVSRLIMERAAAVVVLVRPVRR